MKDKLIFEALAREGEVWHEQMGFVNIPSGRLYKCTCGLVSFHGMKAHYDKSNLTFKTWEDFGWIMDRLPEWEDMEMFFLKQIYIDDGNLEKIDFDGVIPFDLVNPTAMRDALIKFIEGE